LPTAAHFYIFVPAYRRNVPKLDLCAAANFLSPTGYRAEAQTVKKSVEEACRYPTAAYSSVSDKTVDEGGRAEGGEARAAATHKTDTQNLVRSSLCPFFLIPFHLPAKFFVSFRRSSPPSLGSFVNL